MKIEELKKEIRVKKVNIRKLHRLRRIEKKKFHPIQHHIHKRHNISKNTIFYMKEYGPHTNVSLTIIRESIKILLLASFLSSLGGFALESIKHSFYNLLPLVVMLPVLNDMIGDYGIIISSKLSTMLHEGKVNGHRLLTKGLVKLLLQTIFVALLTTALSTGLSLVISGFSQMGLLVQSKIFFIAIIDVLLMVCILFLVSIVAGVYVYSKGEDPCNFLIPITTSIADFGNMIVLAVLVMLLF